MVVFLPNAFFTFQDNYSFTDGAPVTFGLEPRKRAHQLLDGISLEKRAKNFMYQLLANELLPLSVRQDVAYSLYRSTDTTSVFS